MSGHDASAPGPPERAAYGLRLRGVDPAGLTPAEGLRWPVVEVRQQPGSIGAGDPSFDDQGGVLELLGGRRLHLQRAPARATFSGSSLSPNELLHPFLTPIGVAFGRWLGRETFHAGAFLAGGGAWALLGPREAGKSSLLAGLAARGVSVLSDDLLVTDGREAYAGPRRLDLRDPPAPPLARELSIERARERTRWRIRLGPVHAAVPLHGWFFLSWSRTIELEPLPASTALARLAQWRGLPQLRSDPARMLQLAALPAWELRRPRCWSALEDTLTVLIEATRRQGHQSR